MSDEERKKLRDEINELSDIKIGGYSPGLLAGVITRSVLMLDESVSKLDKSSGRLARVNIGLTVVILAVGVLQVWLMTGCSHQPTQRFVAVGKGEMTLVLDSQTGLTCATSAIKPQGESFGKTLLAPVEEGFVPFCADIYANERRVMKDFNNWTHQPHK